jgi:hypothetical protein
MMARRIATTFYVLTPEPDVEGSSECYNVIIPGDEGFVNPTKVPNPVDASATVDVGRDPSLPSPASGTKRCDSCLVCCYDHSSEWGPGAGLSERCSNTLTIPIQSLTKDIWDLSDLKGSADCYTCYHRCPQYLWKLDSSEIRVLAVHQWVHEYLTRRSALVSTRHITAARLTTTWTYGVCRGNCSDQGSKRDKARGKVSPTRRVCLSKEDKGEAVEEGRSVGHNRATRGSDSIGNLEGAALIAVLVLHLRDTVYIIKNTGYLLLYLTSRIIRSNKQNMLQTFSSQQPQGTSVAINWPSGTCCVEYTCTCIRSILGSAPGNKLV